MLSALPARRLTADFRLTTHDSRLVKIYTRTGDAGDTALFGGGRVPKDHIRVAAYGDVDELNSVIGLVRATAPVAFEDALLESIQRDLFSIGGHLATPDPDKVPEGAREGERSPPTGSTEFERVIDAADRELRAAHGVRAARRHPEGRQRCISRAPSAVAPSGRWCTSPRRRRCPSSSSSISTGSPIFSSRWPASRTIAPAPAT